MDTGLGSVPRFNQQPLESPGAALRPRRTRTAANGMNLPRPRHPNLRLRTAWPAPHAVLVTVRGDLDSATAADLASLLSDRLWATPEQLVVDLSEVDFLGVAGVGVLLHAALQAGQGGTDLLVVTGANAGVRRALRVTGADRSLALAERRPAPAPA
ncbi:STAS domain-containing protein [Amycolatopsis sp. CA-126428]|uniref:STAS domain-containing protein n=1 Tax=Amycolatopsis sp. CA-126428 TaxID=2073158 RepID=UPI001E633CD7|nr:STAS domain-containing protein [Amycolatopsis sp. CA-126428]